MDGGGGQDARVLVERHPGHLAGLIALIDRGTISGKIAKKVFEQMVETGGAPEEIVREQGLVQVSDTAELEKAVQEVLDAHPQMAEDFRGGKEKVFGFLMGQVMKATRGRGRYPEFWKATTLRNSSLLARSPLLNNKAKSPQA